MVSRTFRLEGFAGHVKRPTVHRRWEFARTFEADGRFVAAGFEPFGPLDMELMLWKKPLWLCGNGSK